MPDSLGTLHSIEDTASEPAPVLTRRLVFWVGLALVALVAFSEHLSLNRIYQVDELEAAFTARLLVTGQAPKYDVAAPLMVIGPMMWIAGAVDRAMVLMRAERLLFLPVFWLNLCLIVRCAGLRLRSFHGLVALFLVATLAPLWDYGFEIRHDNLLLTALLLAWSVARPLGGRPRRLFLVGLLLPIAQFLSFKAFVYMLPIAAYAVFAAWWDDKRPLWRAASTVFIGALTGFAAVCAVHLVGGTWPLFYYELTKTGSIVSIVTPFNPLVSLIRLVYQCPMLLVGVVFAALQARKDLIPEAFLLAIAVIAILVNPTPFPYNLVLLVPQASILCLRTHDRAQALWTSAPRWKVALSAMLVVHVALWFLATRRHLYMSNARQAELMTAAEDLTDPVRHSVLDGTGLVPTRNPPNRHWLIHSFTVRNFRDGTWPSIRSQLAEGRTPVVIPNYQLFWLPREDHLFLEKHYVALAGDFLVPGTVANGPTQWNCLVPGRYYVSARASMDGRPLPAGPVLLPRGQHVITPDGAQRVSIVWLGPWLQAPPALGPGDSARVLVNWY